jgi:hypothetical protein
MGVDKVAIWNRALGRVSGGTVADENEQSMAAKYCRLFWDEIVGNMLSGPGDWSYAKQRITLSLAPTNDRPNEWLYAYSTPSNMAKALRVIPDLTSAGVLVPVPLPGNPYAETWETFLDEIAAPYILDAGVIYCNAQNAVLEYEINDLTNVNVSPLVTRALAAELAAMLAGSPVKKDAVLAKALAQVADLNWQQAIAEDRNRQPENWGNYESEAILARHDDLWSC